MKISLFLFLLLLVQCKIDNCRYLNSINTNTLYNCENNFKLETTCGIDSFIIENADLKSFDNGHLLILPNEGAKKVNLKVMDSMGGVVDHKKFNVVENPLPKITVIFGEKECDDKCELELEEAVPVTFKMEVDARYRDQCYLDSYFTVHSFNIRWYRNSTLLKNVPTISLEKEEINNVSKFKVNNTRDKNILDSIMNNAASEDFLIISTSKIIKEGSIGGGGVGNQIIEGSNKSFIVKVE